MMRQQFILKFKQKAKKQKKIVITQKEHKSSPKTRTFYVIIF